ncbi:MAG: IS66 family insertion sequence element accessory protein TnpB [Thiolinea sp.]
MIPISSSARIWIATGYTDMRKGMQGLSLLVQESLGRDPFSGDVFVFRGRGGSLIKALWHDGLGLSLYAKRLDRGRFVWPVTGDDVVALTAAMLEAIDWRNPQHTWRPQSAG